MRNALEHRQPRGRNPTGSSVHVLDLDDPHKRLAIRGHAAMINSVLFHHTQDRLVTGSHDRTIKFWDLLTGQETLTLSGHEGAVALMTFSPDGRRLLTADTDGQALYLELSYGSTARP